MLNNAAALFGSPIAPSTGAFESIASATGTGSSTTITFSSIPSTYTSLQLRIAYFTATAGDVGFLRINSDTGSNYARHLLQGNGSTAAASGQSSQTSLLTDAGATGTFTDKANVVIIDIHNYASTSQYKTVRIFSGVDANGSGTVSLQSGLWMSTNAISSLSFYTSTYNLTTNTIAALYGIKGA